MRNGVADIETSSIICDPRCQSRVGIDLALVQEYAHDIQRNEALPLMSTIKTEEGYYLYDGFHRLEAYRIAGQFRVRVEFKDGDVWDAIERSCSVNATHGKRRTAEDTKRAVETILNVMEHRGEKWSQGEIAERCAITQPRVSQILRDNPSYKDLYDGNESFTLVRRRNGVAYEMDTRNIGKRPDLAIDPSSDIDDEPLTEVRIKFTELAKIGFGPKAKADVLSISNAPGASSTPALAGAPDAEDDWEEVEELPASTPEECQSVVTALEALLLALQRPEDDGNEHVMLTEVIEYLTTDAGANADDQKWMLTELDKLYLNIMSANGVRVDALVALRRAA